jgi:NADPH2:quinone reductase
MTMRAIQATAFGDASVLRQAEVPVPEPSTGEVRVRVRAAGVNPVEVYIRNGGYGAKDPDLPHIPGSDAAGTVDAIGTGVTGYAVGDRVFVAGRGQGTYAEYTVSPSTDLGLLPDGLSYAQGASVGVPGLAAHRALFGRGGLRAGETVLVHGASGAVGQMAVQLAAAAGAVVIGTAGSHDGLAAIEALGAAAVDHSRSDQYERIRELTGGRGVDLTVEMLANVNLADDAGIMARHGRIMVVGSRGSLDFTPRLLMAKELDVRGVTNAGYLPDERAAAVADLARRLADGSLVPLVGRTFALADAGAAQDHVMTARALGKVVLEV